MADEIPFFDLAPLISRRRDSVLGAITGVIDSGVFIGGSVVEDFEVAFAREVGVEHCVAVGNGLDALRISLECLGVGPGDEVIVPGFTFYATWLAVMQVGARPVPVDVRLETASLDPDLLGGALSELTRAILPVHLYGIPADMAAIDRFAREHGLQVLEDVAQAHGARVGGRSAGAWGDAAAYSFYPTKNLGALGDAGALVTDDPELARRARSRRSYGQGANKYDHVDTGWNSRMDPIQAAVLREGLARLAEDNSRRRTIAAAYLAALADVPGAVVGSSDPSASVWHHFVLRTRGRAQVRQWLLERGIGTDIHYPYAFDQTSPTAKVMLPGIELHRSRSLADSVLSLPMGPWMTQSQVERVAAALGELPRELLQGSDRP